MVSSSGVSQTLLILTRLLNWMQTETHLLFCWKTWLVMKSTVYHITLTSNKIHTYIHTYIHIYIYIYAQKLWPHARMDVTDCNNIAFAWKQEIFRTCCNILQELRCTYVCKNAFKSQHVFDWRIRRLVAHR